MDMTKYKIFRIHKLFPLANKIIALPEPIRPNKLYIFIKANVNFQKENINKKHLV